MLRSLYTCSRRCYPPHAGHCQDPACHRQSSGRAGGQTDHQLRRRERLADRWRGPSCGRVHRPGFACWKLGAGVVLGSNDVIRSARRTILHFDNIVAANPTSPVSRCLSQVHAVLSEMWAASASAREVTASPRPCNSAKALPIRACSAARRASASGRPSGVSCGRLVISVVIGKYSTSSAHKVTTTRQS